MSFKCELCDKQQPTGSNPVKIVTEKRHKEYQPIKNRDGEVVKTPTGWEIVKEINCCFKCANKNE